MATSLWGADGSVKSGTATVALVDSWDLSLDIADLDVTSLGDTWQTLQAAGGLRKCTGSIKVKHAVDDTAGQDTLMSNAIGGTAVVLSLYESGTSSFWSGSAMLHPSITMPASDKASATYSFTSTGTWSHTG